MHENLRANNILGHFSKDWGSVDPLDAVVPRSIPYRLIWAQVAVVTSLLKKNLIWTAITPQIISQYLIWTIYPNSWNVYFSQGFSLMIQKTQTLINSNLHSAYCLNHTMETALLKTMNHISVVQPKTVSPLCLSPLISLYLWLPLLF